jgi:pentatricopeptide repeat protein
MQRQGVVPDVITCSALISACGKGKQPERALEVFEAMQRQGVVPNVITYSALISACPELAAELFEAMQQQDITPHIISYSDILGCCEWQLDFAQEVRIIACLFTDIEPALLKPIVIAHQAE